MALALTTARVDSARTGSAGNTAVGTSTFRRAVGHAAIPHRQKRSAHSPRPDVYIRRGGRIHYVSVDADLLDALQMGGGE